LARAEYGVSIDYWLDYQIVSLTSEQAVVGQDIIWQHLLKTISMVNILLDQHDSSSEARLRPDFTATFNGVLVIKGEAKTNQTDMLDSKNELVSKFHKTAYKLFPVCKSIPAIMTCNESISLYSIEYFNKQYILTMVKLYNIGAFPGRVDFIVDIFKILIWIMSQTDPIEGYHIAPTVRTKTRNGHHITLLREGLLKEFDVHKLVHINISLIGDIYALQLPNVEHGTINCSSITITRVGSRLRDAIIARHMNRDDIFQQVYMGIQQLHAHDFAHCDICVDNIFVDSIEDGGEVFIGDLEYCRLKNLPPPMNIKRADASALTAEQLDDIQLMKFKDELASI
jgi:hypothetical protein